VSCHVLRASTSLVWNWFQTILCRGLVLKFRACVEFFQMRSPVFKYDSKFMSRAILTWDEELLTSLFWPIDVQRILNIPLSRRGMEDFVSWHFNKNGIFTVKSAYDIEWEHQHGRKIRRSNLFGTSRISPVWKTLCFSCVENTGQ
jgi:hypothetical protein